MKNVVDALFTATIGEVVLANLKCEVVSHTMHRVVDDDGYDRIGMTLETSEGICHLLISPSETPDGMQWLSLWMMEEEDFQDAFLGTMTAKELQTWCVMKEHNCEVVDVPMGSIEQQRREQ